jgi:hypothetical protein
MWCAKKTGEGKDGKIPWMVIFHYYLGFDVCSQGIRPYLMVEPF